MCKLCIYVYTVFIYIYIHIIHIQICILYMPAVAEQHSQIYEPILDSDSNFWAEIKTEAWPSGSLQIVFM